MELLRERKVKGRIYLIARVQEGGKVFEKSLGAKDKLTKAEIRLKLATFVQSVREHGDASLETRQAPEPTYADLWPRMLDDIAELKQWRNPESRRAWALSLGQYAQAAFGNLRPADIGRDEVLALLKPLWTTKTETAKRLRMRLETFFDWAKVHGFYAGDNPARWKGNLELFLPAASKVRKVAHHEAPTMDELRKTVAYCMEHPCPVSGLILFTIATVARIGESRLATKSEIKKDTWIMPAARRKDGKAFPHRVPLSTLAADALDMAADGDLLFTATGKPINIDSPRLKLCTILGRKVTMHGIRSTFRDWAAVEGIDFIAAEKALSHQVGTAVTQAYLREDMLEARRPIMERWAQALKKQCA